MQVIEALDTIDVVLASTNHQEQAILRDNLLNRFSAPVGQLALREDISNDWSAVLFDSFIDAQVERLQPIEGALEAVNAELGGDLGRAFAARTVLARKFDRNPADFNCVVDQRKGRPGRLAVMATSRAGIFRGSWDDIFARETRGDYMIMFEGKEVDTRAEMGFELYQAMVATEHARSPRAILPDTHDAVHTRWSNTWLTGQRRRYSKGDEAPVAYVLDGGPVIDLRPKNVGDVRGWVRPVIVL